MKDFYKFSIKNLEKYKHKNILDVGCNDGSQLDIFKKNGFKTFGVDPARIFIKFHLKNIRFYVTFLMKKQLKK